MFNWFKNKIELKSENCLMHSQYERKGFKVNANIVVPNNFECLIYYNSKHYETLKPGTYSINEVSKKILSKIKKRVRRVKLIPHFISKINQNIEIVYKKNKYTIIFVVDDTIKFAEFILLYNFKTDNSYTTECINDMFCEVLNYYNNDYKSIPSNALANLGINIISISPKGGKVSIFNTPASNQPQTSKQQLQHSDNTVNIVEYDSANSMEKISDNQQSQQAISTNVQEEHNDKTDDNVNNSTITHNHSTCPKCGNVVRFKTTYCLKCGYKLEE